MSEAKKLEPGDLVFIPSDALGTKPWLGWSSEYPDEGMVAVDAVDEADALRQVRELLNADDVEEGDEPMEVDVRPVTAQDVSDLQDQLEESVVELKTKVALVERAKATGHNGG